MARAWQPSYKQITEALQGEIRDHFQPGDKLDPAALATRFAVSTRTLREALSALAQEGLIERRRRAGTFVRDRSADQHVAVVCELDVMHPATSYFFKHAVQATREQLVGQGVKCRLYLGHTPPNAGTALPPRLTCAEFADEAARGHVAGAILIATNTELLPPGVVGRLPTVGHSHACAASVDIDYGGFIEDAVRRCRAAGRERIAVLGQMGTAPGPYTMAFLQAMATARLQVRPGWLQTRQHPVVPGAGWDGLLDIWGALPEKPDALLITEDVLFTDAAKAILGLGIKVPEQLLVASVTCHGAGVHMPFPVLRYEMDPERYARVLAGEMLRLLRGDPPPAEPVKVGYEYVDPDPAMAAAVAKLKAVRGQ